MSVSSGELHREAACKPQSVLAAQHPSRKDQAAQQCKVQAPAAPADTAESGGLRMPAIMWIWVWVFFHFTYLFSLPSCPSGSCGSRYILSPHSWFAVPTTLLLWLSLPCGVSLKCSFKISPYSSCSTGTFLCAWLAQRSPWTLPFPLVLPEMITSLNPQAVRRGEPQQSSTQLYKAALTLPRMGWNRTARERWAGSRRGNNHRSTIHK